MKQEQIEALINDMTIEEKLAQMTQLSPLFFGVEDDVDLTGPMAQFHLSGALLPCFFPKNPA